MRRRLFTLASAVSLVLLVGVVVLWVRSYGHWNQLIHNDDLTPNQWYASSQRGRVAIYMGLSSRTRSRALAAREIGTHLRSFPLPRVGSVLDLVETRKPPQSEHEVINVGRWGFRFVLDETTGRFAKREWLVGLPYYAIVLASPAMPVLWTVSRMRSRHRSRMNRCSTCGYDLTGNLSGTCPECGTPVPKRVSA